MKGPAESGQNLFAGSHAPGVGRLVDREKL
jgi:hypothetical protein